MAVSNKTQQDIIVTGAILLQGDLIAPVIKTESTTATDSIVEFKDGNDTIVAKVLVDGTIYAGDYEESIGTIDRFKINGNIELRSRGTTYTRRIKRSDNNNAIYFGGTAASIKGINIYYDTQGVRIFDGSDSIIYTTLYNNSIDMKVAISSVAVFNIVKYTGTWASNQQNIIFGGGTEGQNLKSATNVSLIAYASNSGSNQNGGNIYIDSGAKDGSGIDGDIYIGSTLGNIIIGSGSNPAEIQFEDTTVSISRDIYDNLLFEDPNAGILTLSELSAINLIITVGNIDIDLTVGITKAIFFIPYNIEVTDLWAGLGTVCTGSDFIIDVNQNGGSILGTKIVIDEGENTSLTAATPEIVTGTMLTKGDKITIDIDQVGSTITGKGLSVYLEGVKY